MYFITITKLFLLSFFPLLGHYQYLGDTTPDYANLKNISRRGAGIYRQSSLTNEARYETQSLVIIHNYLFFYEYYTKIHLLLMYL